MRLPSLTVHLFLALLFTASAHAASDMKMYSPFPFQVEHQGIYTPVGASYAGVTDFRRIWIYNQGDAVLNLLNTPTVSNEANCSGGIYRNPVDSVIQAGQFTYFDVLFTPNTVGPWSYRVSLSSNDPNPTTFTFTINGNAAALPLGSEIALYRPFPIGPIPDGGIDVVTGTVAGVATNLIYTISNEGMASLIFAGPIQVLNLVNCAVDVTPVPTDQNPLISIGRANFTLRVTPTLQGAWSFAIKIISDDSDEGTYDVIIQGTATGVPEIAIARGATAIVDGTITPPGDVLSPLIVGFTNVFTYTVTNPGNGTLTLGTPTFAGQTNCTVTNRTSPPVSLAAGTSATFAFNVVPTAAGAVSFTTSIVTNDANENPSNWLSTGTAVVAEREIAITRSAVNIPHTGSDSLFSIPNSISRTATYTVTNVGYADLAVGAVSVNGLTNCAVVVTQPGASTLAAPADTSQPFTSTTFALAVTPGADGAFSFNVSVANNDTNEAPYTFAVNGTARPDPQLGESEPPCGLGSGFTILMLGAFGMLMVGRRRR